MLSFKGESAWKANRWLLMIWVNSSEDGWTSVLLCRPVEPPQVERFVFLRALPLLRVTDELFLL